MIILFPTMRLGARGAAGFGALMIAAAAPITHGAAPHRASTLRCTNEVSHASWQIHIDFERRTVDSNPARISDATIKWRDRTDGGNYTLDRNSGNLTVIVASSTGGYSLNYRCEPVVATRID